MQVKLRLCESIWRCHFRLPALSGRWCQGALVAPSDEVPTETPRPRRFDRQVNKEKLCENFMASCKCSSEKFGGHIQVVSFVEQAEVVRSQCMAEREQCSCTETVPKCIMTDDRPINEIQGGGKFFDGGWQMITMPAPQGSRSQISEGRNCFCVRAKDR